ncbi:hypothetical protein ACI77I_11685 [Pseudomonas sp. D47]|uniref:hypothetical protein n=1 Tax=Pseudomonas sp. D47 TaxID=3159447 RepID=UPI00387B9970
MSLYVQSPLGTLVSQEESVALRNLAAMACELDGHGTDQSMNVAKKFFLLLSKTADDLITAHTKISGGCAACGQTDAGQTGEYPCKACGLPMEHDKKA